MPTTLTEAVTLNSLFCLLTDIDCALCPNDRTVVIFETSTEDYEEWNERWVLDEHTQKVHGIDWAHRTNKLVTCSADCTAYVWTYQEEEDSWHHRLVHSRCRFAAHCCKWSSCENKFAIGTARAISVCSFLAEYNWWISKLMKRRFRSSVVSVAWSPVDNTVLAAASTDGNVYVLSAYFRNLDDVTQKLGPFGRILAEYEVGTWVHDVAFSPRGKYLGWVAHDSCVHIVPFGEHDSSSVQCVTTGHLPFRSLLFLSDDKVVCGGWNYCPILFTRNEDGYWGETENLDEEKRMTTKRQSHYRMAGFIVPWHGKKGPESIVPVTVRHKNIINDIVPLEWSDDGTIVNRFSTSGIDGRIFFW